MHKLLVADNIDSKDLEIVLKARDNGKVDFLLVDVREKIEYDEKHLKGVDMLKPTSIFKEWIETLFTDAKNKIIIFTCRTGHRSGQVQNVFKSNGHKRVINHVGGIVSYNGKIER